MTQDRNSSQGAEVRSVYLTFPDEASAVGVLSSLLDEHLIACANLVPGARSLYRWEGAVQDEPEVVAFAKTTTERLSAVLARVHELHPYDTPCAVSLEVRGGLEGYLEWVRQETS